MKINSPKAIKIKKKTDGLCYYCGCRPSDEMTSFDHIKPKCEGGKNSYENLILSCKQCNSLKASLTLEQFRVLKAMKKSGFEGRFVVGFYDKNKNFQYLPEFIFEYETIKPQPKEKNDGR